jgi:hypothetical protein
MDDVARPLNITYKRAIFSKKQKKTVEATGSGWVLYIKGNCWSLKFW